mgnify:CR=1 FL=1
MITKQAIDYIISICKQYIDDVLFGWGLSKEEKELVAFEEEHMPYTKYSGNQSVDHVLFRKFLRRYDPQKIEDSIAGNVIEIFKDQIQKLESENAELRKKLAEVEQLTYAAL